MKAIRYHEHGDADVMTLETVETPTPGHGEVLVDVRAASVNPIDTYVRDGTAPPVTGLPHIGGADAAGVVSEVGRGVTDFDEQDRVYATGLGLLQPGTYAEYVVVPETVLALLPDEVSFVDGAAGAMAFATSWRALVDRGELAAGDVCLIHGASGGVGHAAVQIADNAGAFVVATARDGAPAEFAREIGADAVLDYRSDDLAAAIENATDGRPVDVVFEPHADSHIETDLAVLNRGGSIVCIGEEGPISIGPGPAMDGKKADADIRFMSIVASVDDQAAVLSRIAPLLADGTFDVRIEETYPLENVPEAHSHLEQSGVLGKIAVEIQ